MGGKQLQFTVDLIKIAEVVGAAAVIIGVIVGFVKWVIRQSEQDKDIADMKKEQTLLSATRSKPALTGWSNSVQTTRFRKQKTIWKNT